VDHNLVMFKTLHHDGTIDAAPPSATSHYAILNDMPEAKCLFEYDAWSHRQGAWIHSRFVYVL
jgi:hypothetical protein